MQESVRLVVLGLRNCKKHSVRLLTDHSRVIYRERGKVVTLHKEKEVSFLVWLVVLLPPQ